MTLPNSKPQSLKSVGRVEPITTSNESKIECTQQIDRPAQDSETTAAGSSNVSTLVTKSKKAASSLFTLLHAKVCFLRSDISATCEYEQELTFSFHLISEL
jgi:hypothetical protein